GLVLSCAALAQEANVPPQPSDPVAAKAYGVFAQACSGCHQAGRLKSLRQPAGNIGDILDLESLARNPSLVVPGDADASPLYTAMQSRAMPPDAPSDANAEISATELLIVRDWIERLSPPTCPGRQRLSSTNIANLVAKALANVPADQAARTRFI